MRWLLSVLVFSFLCLSCAKHEIKLSFELDKGVTVPCRILFYEQGKNSGEFKETVAEIRGGKGNFKIPAYRPTVIFLYAPSAALPSSVIYAEPGDHIKITGSGEDISQWKIAGNETTETLAEWHARNAETLHKNEPQAISDAVASFVESDPKSAAAAILLYLYFDRRNNEARFLELESMLDRDILNGEDFSSALSAADRFSGLSASDKLPARVVKISDSGFADTLRLEDAPASLLIFRTGSNSLGETTLSYDSIADLIGRNPKKQTAEFYVETDSLAWRRQIAKDTVEGLRRFWLPLGLTDETSLSLGLSRVPYLIVADSLQKVRYRGSDWKQALSVFESL